MPRDRDLPSILLVAAVLWSPGLAAQSYDETQRVTLIDLPVALRSGSAASESVEKAPGGLTVADFEISIDGEPHDPVSLARLDETGPQPYQILIYLDTELSDSRELGLSVGLLAKRAADLTKIATVDLVVADPEPRFVLRDIGQPEMLEAALLSSDWQEEASDQLRALRAGFLVAVDDPEVDLDLETLAITFVEEERRIIQERADLLSTFLAEHPAPGKAKAVLLAGFQYDVAPQRFYAATTGGDPPAAPNPGQPTSDLAASLAAHGWVVLPLAAPPPESPLVPGKRIGKWRIAGPAGGRIIGLRIARESERDPEKARAHLENGQALLAQGSIVEAEQAFRNALHYYYGDPRTASEQAEALVGLAAALEAQGKTDEARVNRQLAAELDGSQTQEIADTLAVLLDPERPLEEIAAVSSGRVLHGGDDLETALADLYRRVRLSFQFEGEPTGELYPTEIGMSKPGWSAVGPRWVRFGSPPMLAAARTRLVMGGWSVDPPADLEASLEEGQLELLLGKRENRGQSPISPLSEGVAVGDVADETPCRVTLATGSIEEGTVVIEHQPVVCHRTEAGLTAASNLPFEAEFASVLLEHLSSGVWGISVVELD